MRVRDPDSTGLYINGAIPTVPAIDLSPTGINLHSGDIFNAQLTYDGITLTVVITDTVTNATATQTYTVDIPYIVAGPTAWVGFTGGSGGVTAVQEILNWSYSPRSCRGTRIFYRLRGVPDSADPESAGPPIEWDVRLELTDGNPNEARSAFFTSPVNIQSSSPALTFNSPTPTRTASPSPSKADGPTAVGASGGQLGYGGMPTA